jgi:hypothetical protein
MFGRTGHLSCLPLLLALIVIAGCRTEHTEEVWTPPPLTDELAEDPDPRVVVKDLIDFMKSLREITVEALVSYEAPQEYGQNLEYDLLQRVALAPPDRMRWMTVHDDGVLDTAWIADGVFTMLKQPANIWGQIEGPPTNREMVGLLMDAYEIDVPFGELLTTSELEQLWLGDEVTELWWVGEAWVQGQWTHHIAMTRPGVEVELWVRKGSEPFPAKMSIEYTEVDGRPSYVARFRKWAAVIPDSMDFGFTLPPDATRVEIVPGD